MDVLDDFWELLGEFLEIKREIFVSLEDSLLWQSFLNLPSIHPRVLAVVRIQKPGDHVVLLFDVSLPGPTPFQSTKHSPIQHEHEFSAMRHYSLKKEKRKTQKQHN